MGSVADSFMREIQDGLFDQDSTSFEVPPYCASYPLYDADEIAETLSGRLEHAGYVVSRAVEERFAGDRDWDLWPNRHRDVASRDNVMPFAYDESRYVEALAARKQILTVTVPTAIQICMSRRCRFCGK